MGEHDYRFGATHPRVRTVTSRNAEFEETFSARLRHAHHLFHVYRYFTIGSAFCPCTNRSILSSPRLFMVLRLRLGGVALELGCMLDLEVGVFWIARE